KKADDAFLAELRHRDQQMRSVSDRIRARAVDVWMFLRHPRRYWRAIAIALSLAAAGFLLYSFRPPFAIFDESEAESLARFFHDYPRIEARYLTRAIALSSYAPTSRRLQLKLAGANARGGVCDKALADWHSYPIVSGDSLDRLFVAEQIRDCLEGSK